MKKKLTIALVAHDNKKRELLEWIEFNRGSLMVHHLVATGTTGRLIEKILNIDIDIKMSGPLGGDFEIGNMIAHNRLDILIFFWDPLEPVPHDPDVKALLRLAVVWNIPTASNRATADMLISSPLFEGEYERTIPDHTKYMNRKVLE